MVGTLMAMLMVTSLILGQGQCVVEEGVELGQMPARLSRRRRCGSLAPRIADALIAADLRQRLFDARRNEGPRALVLRLFLAPRNVRVRKAFQFVCERKLRERIELLDAKQLHARLFTLLAFFQQV